MIAVIDTGGANLGSVTNALDRIQQSWQLTTDPHVITQAKRVILPGVGTAIRNWQRIVSLELVDTIRSLEQPVLGICVGMQLLFASSEEGPTPCLDIIPGQVERFRQPGLVVPHMGWNQVRQQGSCPLWQGIADGTYFYFVHSFRGNDLSKAVGVSHYGGDFPAVVQAGSFFGTQFHPEKSGAQGALFLENFCRL